MACQARRARCIATASAQVGSARTRGHGGRASDRVSLHASAVHSSAGGRNWRAQKLVMGSMPCYPGGTSRRAVEAHMYGAHLDLLSTCLSLLCVVLVSWAPRGRRTPTRDWAFAVPSV